MTRRLLVTGAAGFLGRAVVAKAVAAGWTVRAVVRRSVDIPDAEVVVCDLADAPDWATLLADVDAVIHAAAALRADDSQHSIHTVQPTEALVRAMVAGGSAARLVLVSSFSVYGMAALPDGALVDETTAEDIDLDRRDAYARAKRAQELAAIAAAQHQGLDLWLIRPGVVYGPNRTDCAHLGVSLKGRLVAIGGAGWIPAIEVGRCAAGLVSAARAPRPKGEGHVPVLAGKGRVTVVNLVDPNPPSQAQWLAATGRRASLRLPRGLVFRVSSVLDLAGDLWPWLDARLPTQVRLPALAARFRPLRYSTARADAVLDLPPAQPFDQAMAKARA